MGSVIIIGGGAAGLAAGIAAASCGDRVTVLERMDRVGKKILATGNGRCNLMNTGERRFPGGAAFAEAVLEKCGVAEQTRFWQHIGLRMREEDGGRVYPVSGMASTVLDCLRFALEEQGAEITTGVQADDIEQSKHGFIVTAGEQRFRADRVIVAGGGCAQPKLGSNGSCYELLTRLGHTRTPLIPALTQIITDTAPIKGLAGVRVRCEVRITNGSEEKHRENGELLFADYGVTGVCVMQCARWAAPGDTLHIDLTRALGLSNGVVLRNELRLRRVEWVNRPLTDLLTGLCLPKLAQCLLQAAGVHQPAKRQCGSLNEKELNALVAVISDFCLSIRGVKGFDNAQVTAGGINPADFDPDTLSSRLAPGLHAAGEILDVDGDCGGFNLMFAFGSGILAGLNGRKASW